MALLIVGILTAALDVTLGGFTPIIWRVLSFGLILIIICMEVSMMRAFLESKKKSECDISFIPWRSISFELLYWQSL